MRYLTLAMVFAALLAYPAAPAAAYDTDAPRVDVSYKSLCAAIQAARAELATIPLPDDFRSGEEATGRDAIVAVWRPSVSLTEIRTIEVRDGVSRTHGYAVAVVPSNGLDIPGTDPYNGVNTTYDVTTPVGWYPLAIKVNTRRSGVAIYQPYHVAYQTHELQANGQQYLKEVVQAARARLDALGVQSRWKTGKPLTAAIDPDMLLSLILDEHMDKDEVEVRGIEWSVDKSLTLFALNRERTYYYAISSAAAAGIAQFIKGTYDATRAAYPAAMLPEDLLTGMRDHVTAVMAMHCHADQVFAELAQSRLREPRTPQLRGAVLAAAYNAGAGKADGKRGAFPAYRRHLYFCKQPKYARAWCHKDHNLPDETITYVRKFAGVYDYVSDFGLFPKPGRGAPTRSKPAKRTPSRRS